jgi:hypothetical protein
MIRKLLLVALFAACSKHGGVDNTAQCEKTRDLFLKNYDDRMTKLFAEDNETQLANDKRDSAIEIANAKEKFVAVCKNTPDFKFECFDSVEKEDSADCKKFVHEISHRAVTAPIGK